MDLIEAGKHLIRHKWKAKVGFRRAVPSIGSLDQHTCFESENGIHWCCTSIHLNVLQTHCILHCFNSADWPQR